MFSGFFLWLWLYYHDLRHRKTNWTLSKNFKRKNEMFSHSHQCNEESSNDCTTIKVHVQGMSLSVVSFLLNASLSINLLYFCCCFTKMLWLFWCFLFLGYRNRTRSYKNCRGWNTKSTFFETTLKDQVRIILNTILWDKQGLWGI